MGDVKEFAKDKILGTLQVSAEPWMTFDEIQEISSVVNPTFLKECLKDFVDSQVVEEKDGKYRAIMEDQK